MFLSKGKGGGSFRLPLISSHCAELVNISIRFGSRGHNNAVLLGDMLKVL